MDDEDRLLSFVFNRDEVHKGMPGYFVDGTSIIAILFCNGDDTGREIAQEGKQLGRTEILFENHGCFFIGTAE
jgi:hypothetical protein